MKVLSYIISLIFLWSTGAMAFAPGFLQVAGGGGAVASDTNIALWWNVENATHATGDYPSSGVTWTIASAATITATAAKNGSNGLYPVGTYDYAEVAVSANNIAPSSGRYWLWFKIPTGYFVSGHVLLSRQASANYFFTLSVSGSSSDFELALDGKAGTVWSTITTSGLHLAENNWYFLELVIGTDKAEIIVNGTSGVNSTVSRSLVSGDGYLYVGNASDGIAGRSYEDTVGASTNQSTNAYTLYKDNTVSPR